MTTSDGLTSFNSISDLRRMAGVDGHTRRTRIGEPPDPDSACVFALLYSSHPLMFGASLSAAVVLLLAANTLADDNEAAEEPSPEQMAALAEGKALYRGLCSGCHGGSGRGGKGPNLTDDRWLHGDKDEDITRVIQKRCPENDYEETRRIAKR